MDEPAKLTKKQQQVLKLLREGKTPQAISTKLRVSRAAIYGHIARLKEKGVELPNQEEFAGSNGRSGNGNGGPSAAEFDAPNGFARDLNEVEERTRVAIEEIDGRAQQRLSEIQAERHAIQERMEALNEEEGHINAAISRAKHVEEALV